MENITIGAISETMKFILEFGGLIVAIFVAVKKAVNKAFEPMNKRMDEIEENMKKKIEEVELQTTKNFLIQELSEIKRNKDPLDEVTKKRFFEEYDAYIARKQNSYIKHEVEECQKKGLL